MLGVFQYERQVQPTSGTSHGQLTNQNIFTQPLGAIRDVEMVDEPEDKVFFF